MSKRTKHKRKWFSWPQNLRRWFDIKMTLVYWSSLRQRRVLLGRKHRKQEEKKIALSSLNHEINFPPLKVFGEKGVNMNLFVNMLLTWPFAPLWFPTDDWMSCSILVYKVWFDVLVTDLPPFCLIIQWSRSCLFI